MDAQLARSGAQSHCCDWGLHLAPERSSWPVFASWVACRQAAAPGAAVVIGSAYGLRMLDHRPPLSSVSDFTTWEPVLRLMLAADTDRRAARPARVAGRISQYGTSLAYRGSMSSTARAAVEDIQRALARGGVQEIAFRAETQPDGRTTLGLVWPSPVVEPALGYPDLGVLVLVEGSPQSPGSAVPIRCLERWRRHRRIRNCWSGRCASFCPAPSERRRRRSPPPKRALASRCPMSSRCCTG